MTACSTTQRMVNCLKAYFNEASYGKLNVNTTFYPTTTGDTVVSYQDSLPRAYYQPYDKNTNPTGYVDDNDRTNREMALLKNAVDGVSSQIPSGLNVDNDGDGYVDNVCFVVQGSPTAWSTLLWPHMWELYAVNASINGKRVWTFNFQLEDVTLGYSTAATGGPGVLCHEMFHSLGAPDLYHYTGDGISPAGQWDLMCSNTNPPQHMSAFMKWKYGHWIDSIPTISTTGDYVLNPLTSAAQNCYKIQSPVDPNEYFVVEFRKKTGTFENSLPDSGLLVWRINSTVGDGDAGGPPDEAYVYRQGGTLFSNGDVTKAVFSTSAFPNFNGTTNPSCFLWNGAQGGLDLSTSGPKSGSTMPFHVTIQDPAKRLVFRTQPSDVAVGAAINPAPVVAVVDAAGNTLTGFTGSVTVVGAPARAGVTLSGTTTVNLVNGVATLIGLTFNKAGSAYLTASVPGIVPVNSASFSVTSPSSRGLTSVRAGANPWGIAVNPVTNRVYVSTTNDSSVTVLDGATNTIIAKVSGITYPRGVAVNTVGNKVYVVSQYWNTVTVIDGATNQITKTIPVGTYPWAIVYNPTLNRLYVGNRTSNNISVIDGAHGRSSGVGSRRAKSDDVGCESGHQHGIRPEHR